MTYEEMTYEERRWDYATICSYVPVPDNEDWHECPDCQRRPRAWRFDNGCWARCQCGHKYNNVGKVRAVDVGAYHRTHSGDMTGYDFDGLRKAWNAHVKSLLDNRAALAIVTL